MPAGACTMDILYTILIGFIIGLVARFLKPGDDKMGIIVRKGDPLRLDFNKALSTVKANGVYDKIYQQYFGNTVAAAATASRVTVSTSAAASVTQ